MTVVLAIAPVVPRRAGVDELVSRRLLLGDHLLERVPAAAGPTAAGAGR